MYICSISHTYIIYIYICIYITRGVNAHVALRAPTRGGCSRPPEGHPCPKIATAGADIMRKRCGDYAEVPWAPQGQARSDTKTPQGMMKEVLSPLSSLLVAFCKYFCRSLLTISASPHHPFWCLAPSASGP